MKVIGEKKTDPCTQKKRI